MNRSMDTQVELLFEFLLERIRDVVLVVPWLQSRNVCPWGRPDLYVVPLESKRRSMTVLDKCLLFSSSSDLSQEVPARAVDDRRRPSMIDIPCTVLWVPYRRDQEGEGDSMMNHLFWFLTEGIKWLTWACKSRVKSVPIQGGSRLSSESDSRTQVVCHATASCWGAPGTAWSRCRPRWLSRLNSLSEVESGDAISRCTSVRHVVLSPCVHLSCERSSGLEPWGRCVNFLKLWNNVFSADFCDAAVHR